MKNRWTITGLILVSLFASGLPPAQVHGQSPDDEQGQRQSLQDLEAHGIRGTVTAISGDTVTVKTEQGEVYKIETGPNTHIRKQRDQIKITDLHAGDMVAAVGDKDDKAKTVGAIFLIVFDKEQYERAKADFGKTWTAGVVVSIDEARITLKRPDGATQVVTADENTSFRKHRQSITLLDIKAGDNVSARGSLQNGNFLATVLSVGGPMGPGQRPGAPGENRPQAPQNQ